MPKTLFNVGWVLLLIMAVVSRKLFSSEQVIRVRFAMPLL